MYYLEDVSFPVKDAEELSQKMGYVNCILAIRHTKGLCLEKVPDILMNMFPALDGDARSSSADIARCVTSDCSHDLTARFLDWGVVDNNLIHLSLARKPSVTELYAIWMTFSDYLEDGKTWSINVRELEDEPREWLNNMPGIELTDRFPKEHSVRFCGTKDTIRIDRPGSNTTPVSYIGKYKKDENGNPVEITEDNCGDINPDAPLDLFSIATCSAPGNGCEVCAGEISYTTIQFTPLTTSPFLR